MGSFYSGMEFGEELVDQILEANNVTPDSTHTYRLKDTPFGCKLIEYDKDGEIIESYTTEKTQPIDMSYYSEMKKDLANRKQKNEKAKLLRFVISEIIAGLIVVAFIVIIIGKSVV